MGYAQIAFPGGPGIQFRIDPQSLDWNFQINTSVTNTLGGRVVQVTGATLSDITIQGLFGEDHSKSATSPTEDPPGVSWKLARRFASVIREMMEWQTRDAQNQGKMHQTARFTYPPMGWDFRVYIKDFSDPDGGVISIRPEKFSHGYVLTLFVVEDASAAVVKAGEVNGILNKAKAAAINSYIARISDGIGWKPTQYNGNFGSYYQGLFDTASTGAGGAAKQKKAG